MAWFKRSRAPELAEEGAQLAPSLIHEMRQPLTGLRAGLELLARRLGPEATARDDWQLVVAQTERLEELFRAYQDFLHPERSPAAPFEVPAVVERAVALQLFRLRPLGPRFAVEAPGPVPLAWGLSHALLHAVANVLVNAADALDSVGGGRLLVRVGAGGGGVQVRVADEGPGIPKDLGERIFEPRVTTKAQGSGLGLAIARRMLATFGGRIELAGEKDPQRPAWARTEFVLTLPAAPVPGGPR